MGPSEIEDLLFKKTADLVLLNLFMRTNGKCNYSLFMKTTDSVFNTQNLEFLMH